MVCIKAILFFTKNTLITRPYIENFQETETLVKTTNNLITIQNVVIILLENKYGSFNKKATTSWNISIQFSCMLRKGTFTRSNISNKYGRPLLSINCLKLQMECRKPMFAIDNQFRLISLYLTDWNVLMPYTTQTQECCSSINK